mmetsp:Transcript_58351/g.117209  ORF Transcript_58351/g.117209 Transcript_58351/m.117209 type:complete len:162 (+) Transcript_58351:74-559(+)
MAMASARLKQERKEWRKDHPPDYVAKPKNKADGSSDLMCWHCVIPGKKGSLWEDCKLTLEITFSNDYPMTPPVVKFVPLLWHMNVWSSGRICLNILNPEDGTWHGKWSPSVTIKQILVAIPELLANPYPAGARPEVQKLWETNRPAYDKRLKEEAAKYKVA